MNAYVLLALWLAVAMVLVYLASRFLFGTRLFCENDDAFTLLMACIAWPITLLLLLLFIPPIAVFELGARARKRKEKR